MAQWHLPSKRYCFVETMFITGLLQLMRETELETV